MSGYRLSRGDRIRRRPEFERVYREGVRRSGRFMTVFLLETAARSSRFGVAASRKLGGAVERNRAKRLARELFRRHKIAAGCDVVIVPHREMLDAPFASLEADYQRSLDGRAADRPAADARRRRRRAPGAGQGI